MPLYREIAVKYKLLVALSLVILAPAALGATSAEKIRNEKVLVTENTLAQGESEHLGPNPSMLVFMSDGKTLTTLSNNSVQPSTVKPGQTVMESEEPGLIKNSGSAPLHFVRIEFLTDGSAETWGRTGFPPAYVLLHEDQYARTYDIRIPPHELEPQHTHHARVVVALSGAQLEHILPDGTKQPSTLKTGEIVWRPAATHTGHNMGDTPLWCIAIEPK